MQKVLVVAVFCLPIAAQAALHVAHARRRQHGEARR